MLKVICNNLVLRSGNFFTRKFCSAGIPKKICIVGSGPAGFYTAQYIIKVPLFYPLFLITTLW